MLGDHQMRSAPGGGGSKHRSRDVLKSISGEHLHHHHRPLNNWRGRRATSAPLSLVTFSAQYQQETTIVASFLHHQVAMLEAISLAGLIRAAGSKHSKSASFSFLATRGEGSLTQSTELQSA